jgi:hypothetical protein
LFSFPDRGFSPNPAESLGGGGNYELPQWSNCMLLSVYWLSVVVLCERLKDICWDLGCLINLVLALVWSIMFYFEIDFGMFLSTENPRWVSR